MSVLVICNDPIGRQMAGGGIRYFELAKALRPHAEVVLATPGPDDSPLDGMRRVNFDSHRPRSLESEIAAADTIISRPQWPLMMRQLRRSNARLVFDLYIPEAFEALVSEAHKPAWKRKLLTDLAADRLVDALRTGQHFICVGQRQRDAWIGAMLAERLIQPETYDRDPSLRSVIDAVPFGAPSEPARRTDAEGLRDRFPEIGPDDEVVLWSGAIWRWLDAPTAVRAVGHLAERRPGVRLVFVGALDAEPARAATEETRQVAEELGLLGKTVFFNDGWVPYADRVNWLLDADCAVWTRPDQVETRYAISSRLVDCFWAGLPIVCSSGDELVDRIERDDLGATAPHGDHEALAAALEGVLDRGRSEYAERLARAAADYSWPVVAEPLVRFINSPDPPSPLRNGVLGKLSRRPSERARSLAYRLGRHYLHARTKA